MANVSNIENYVIFSYLHLKYVNNGIKIRGACYSAEIRNFISTYSKGYDIYLQGFFDNPTIYAPNHCKITGFQTTGEDAGTAIYVKGDGGDYNPTGVWVTDSWIEAKLVGIYTEGDYLKVQNTHIGLTLANAIGIHLGTTAQYADIIGNSIITSGLTSYGIKIDQVEDHTRINSNEFFHKVYGIGAVGNHYNVINGNKFFPVDANS